MTIKGLAGRFREAAALAVLLALPAAAKPGRKPVIVGVRVNPPFMFHEADGSWDGITIDLWKHVAGEVKIPYELKEYKSPDLRSADNKHFLPFEKNGLDVLANAVIDRDTEEFNDTSAPYYFTGLSIATRPDSKRGLLEFLGRLLTPRFLESAALLACAPLIMGVLVWRIERRKNKREFGGPQAMGLAAAILWACESMVGKSRPILRTWPARILTIGWTFGCIMLLSAATAKLSSEFTLNQLGSRITGPKDLPYVKVGARKTSAGLTLQKRGIAFTPYETDAQAVDALARGEVDAVVASAAFLQYYVAKNYPKSIVVLPGTFTHFSIGFGLTKGSPLTRKINVAMLDFMDTDQWQQVIATYMGSSTQ